MTSYTFNITERDTNTLTASIRHTSTLPLVVDGSNGLVPDQVYRLVIEAENSVGSTLSEEILICEFKSTFLYVIFTALSFVSYGIYCRTLGDNSGG